MPLVMVIFVNIVLSGDNAVVIALASRNLPPGQKKKAIFWGSALAVALRIVLVVIATLLMRVPFLQFVGGLALVYIGYHLLASEEGGGEMETSESFWGAVKVILVADLIMSLDNVLAIAGVAKGSWIVLGVGLAVSIPLVIFGAQILAMLMDRFPIIVYIGSGLIAYTAAEMMCADKLASHYLEPYALLIKIGITAGVLALGYWRKSKERKGEAAKETASTSI